MFEVCYTSLPAGLDPGTTGYTTVGRTKGLSRGLAEAVSNLNGYEPVVLNPTAYASNPVNYSHVVKSMAGRRVHVVSRVGACEPDHSGRSNFLAHHVLLADEELAACPAGPAAVAASGMFMSQWAGDARELDSRALPQLAAGGPSAAAIAKAGLATEWGQALADRMCDPFLKTWLIYPQQMDMLGVVSDVLSYLPLAERWQATFATYATKQFPPSVVDCRLRCVPAGTPFAAELAARGGADVFDLTKNPAPPPRRKGSQPATAAQPRGSSPAVAGRSQAPARPHAPARPAGVGLADDLRDVNLKTGFDGPGISLPPPFVGGQAASARSNGAPWWLVAVPSVLAVAAAGAAFYSAVQLGQARTEVEEKTQIVGQVRRELDKERKQLQAKNSELAVARAKINEKTKALDDLKVQLADLNARSSDAGTDRATPSPPPQPTVAANAEPSPVSDASAPKAKPAETAETPSVAMTRSGEQPVSTDVEDDKGSRGQSPQNPEQVAQAAVVEPAKIEEQLLAMQTDPKKQNRVLLVESVPHPLPANADITASDTVGAAGVLKVTTTKVKVPKGGEWEVKYGTHEAFKIVYEGQALVLKLNPYIKKEQIQDYIEKLFFIQLDLQNLSASKPRVVMRRPVDAKLQLVGGGQFLEFGRQYELFADANANARLAKAFDLFGIEKQSALIERLEFSKDWQALHKEANKTRKLLIKNSKYEFPNCDKPRTYIVTDKPEVNEKDQLCKLLEAYEKTSGKTVDFGAFSPGVGLYIVRNFKDSSCSYEITGFDVPLRCLNEKDFARQREVFDEAGLSPELSGKIRDRYREIYARENARYQDALRGGDKTKGNKTLDQYHELFQNWLRDEALLRAVAQLPVALWADVGVRLTLITKGAEGKQDNDYGGFIVVDSIGSSVGPVPVEAK
jgi:hypothetical protein